jgi:hypothetical protein
MLVVSRFDAAPDDIEERGRTALAVLAVRAGFVRGSLGRAADDPSAWVLVTEWVGVGAWRRALSSYDVKVHASPLLALGRDEPSAFEVLVATDAEGTREQGSDRAE